MRHCDQWSPRLSNDHSLLCRQAIYVSPSTTSSAHPWRLARDRLDGASVRQAPADRDQAWRQEGDEGHIGEQQDPVKICRRPQALELSVGHRVTASPAALPAARYVDARELLSTDRFQRLYAIASAQRPRDELRCPLLTDDHCAICRAGSAAIGCHTIPLAFSSTRRLLRATFLRRQHRFPTGYAVRDSPDDRSQHAANGQGATSSRWR